MRFPKLVASVTLAGALVLVAGCDSSTPSADPTTARTVPSVTRSSTPGPPSTLEAEEFDATIPPARPAGLDGPPSQETAGEAAGYFMSLFAYVFATGDVTEWKRLSGEACDYCDGVIDAAAEYQDEGKRTSGGRIEITDVQAFDYMPGEFAVVVAVTQHPSQVINAEGERAGEAGVTTASAEMHLVWAHDQWRVETVDLTMLTES